MVLEADLIKVWSFVIENDQFPVSSLSALRACNSQLRRLADSSYRLTTFTVPDPEVPFFLKNEHWTQSVVHLEITEGLTPPSLELLLQHSLPRLKSLHLKSYLNNEFHPCSPWTGNWPQLEEIDITFDIVDEANFDFPAFLLEIPTLKTLKGDGLLEQRTLRGWPKGSLRNLRSFEIDGANELQALPRNFTDLQELTCLRLKACRELQLPESISNLRNLAIFEYYDHGYLQLPAYLSTLPTLKELYIGSNALDDDTPLLDMSAATNLEVFSAKESLNIGVPPWLSVLPKLRHLELGAPDEMDDGSILGFSIRDSIHPQAPLTFLSLSNDMMVTDLEEWLPRLKDLHVFKLHGCSSLESLPNSIGQLRNLKVLDLTGCHLLPALPPALTLCTALEELVLVGCDDLDLTSEDSHSVFPTSLKVLNLSSCSNFDTLSLGVLSCTKLEKLILNRCALVNFPPNIGRFANLQELSIDSCFSLEELPEAITELQSLKVLTARHCNLLNVEPLVHLTSLQSLILNHCRRLQNLPDNLGALSNLTELGLNNCSGLLSLPSTLGHLSKLKKLSNDSLSALEQLPSSIGLLTQLKSLNLRHAGKLERLPDEICNMTRLTSIDLADCRSLRVLPSDLGNLTSLKMLNIRICKELRELPPSMKGFELSAFMIAGSGIEANRGNQEPEMNAAAEGFMDVDDV